MLGQKVVLQSGKQVFRHSSKKQELDNLYGAEYIFYSTALLNSLEKDEHHTYLTALIYDYRHTTVLAHCRYFAKQVEECQVEIISLDKQTGAEVDTKPITIYLIDNPSEYYDSQYRHNLYFFSTAAVALGYRFRYNGGLYGVTARHLQWGKAFYQATTVG